MRWFDRLRRWRNRWRWPWWLTLTVWGPAVWMVWLGLQSGWVVAAADPMHPTMVPDNRYPRFGAAAADAQGRVYYASSRMPGHPGPIADDEVAVYTFLPSGRATSTPLRLSGPGYWFPIDRLTVSPSGQRWWTVARPWLAPADRVAMTRLTCFTSDGLQCGQWLVRLGDLSPRAYDRAEPDAAICADGESSCLLASTRGIYRYQLGADQPVKLRASSARPTMLDASGGLWSVSRGAVTYTEADGNTHAMNLADVGYSASLVAFTTSGPWLYAEASAPLHNHLPDDHVVYRFHRSGRTERLVDLAAPRRMRPLTGCWFGPACCLAVDTRGRILCRAGSSASYAPGTGQVTIARLEQRPLWRIAAARWSH